ncbi:MAG: UDP-N-acetylmuramoylalanyl-D-glutamyl-2,6-diaminopimelate--D-alanyl-D-alanine ligase [Rhodospirillaceae bacterium]|nr:UDP-N-acetylmuramoylalanyl-D-glutamyl-2,6-diaminopimelate--D-alanyl-D-alanine ligase [Rhodospirillaceae bacterium]
MKENPVLWTDTEAAAATSGRASAPFAVRGVSIDTRTLAKGDLFCAIEGVSQDGHQYVAAAFAAGAAAALVQTGRIAAPAGPVLEVPDTLAALNALGRASRDRSKGRIAAVTGSVGKTGTKEALRTVLSAQALTHASEGSLNNHWGAPLSLARMPRECAYGVFELGMNHPGEIEPLARLVRPHVAVITWIAPAHTAFFKSVAEIADAKAEIFTGLAGGTAVLPRDNEHFDRLRRHAEKAGVARIVAFGAAAGAEARLVDAALGPTSSTVTAEFRGTRLRYTIGSPGRHWVANSLAVLAAAEALGADLPRAAAALAQVRPPKGRGARHRVAVPGGTFTLIDESYNASPEAVRAALATLALAAPELGGRRIAVLGDMRELGDDADAIHAALAPDFAAAKVDAVFTSGIHTAALAAALPARLRGAHAPDSAALLPLVVAAVRAGDVVMVKGSLGSRMAPIVQALLALGGASPTKAGA